MPTDRAVQLVRTARRRGGHRPGRAVRAQRSPAVPRSRRATIASCRRPSKPPRVRSTGRPTTSSPPTSRPTGSRRSSTARRSSASEKARRDGGGRAVPNGRRPPRLTAVRRDEERVTPLELFFDLVFVLAIHPVHRAHGGRPDLDGLGRGLVVLAVLWWAWVGYAWLTSVLDPEEGAVRIVDVRGDGGTARRRPVRAAGVRRPRAHVRRRRTGCVRAAHIGLFVIASRDDPGLRRSVVGLGDRHQRRCGPARRRVVLRRLDAGAHLGGRDRARRRRAVALRRRGMASSCRALRRASRADHHHRPRRVDRGHRRRRRGRVDAGIIVAACLGIAIAAALWWAYFDVVAVVAAAPPGVRSPRVAVQNAMARDSYSILHFPMVAGIVLIALGMKKTLEHVDEPLETGTRHAPWWAARRCTCSGGGVPAAQPAERGTGSGCRRGDPLSPTCRWRSRCDSIVTVATVAAILWG